MDTYHACAPDDIIPIKTLNLFHEPPYEESKDCKKNLHDSQSTIFYGLGVYDVINLKVAMILQELKRHKS